MVALVGYTFYAQGEQAKVQDREEREIVIINEALAHQQALLLCMAAGDVAVANVLLASELPDPRTTAAYEQLSSARSRLAGSVQAGRENAPSC